MMRSTLFLTLLSLQGVFAGLGKESRAVVTSNTDISSRNALPGYKFGHIQKRQDDDNNNEGEDAEKQFSLPEVQSMADLSIENMDEVDLPRLETVDGNLTIAGTENLETLELPALRRVSGNLVLDGAFTAVELPALTEVGGAVSVASSHDNFNCTAFEDDLADVDVGGDLLCQSPQNNDDDEDENDRDDDNDDNADDDNDDDGGGDDTSGAAGAPRPGWLALLAVPALLML